MEMPFDSISQMQEVGIFWVIIGVTISFALYLAPVIKKRVERTPELFQKIAESMAVSASAIDKMLGYLEDREKGDNTTRAILIEHDSKMEIRISTISTELHATNEKLDYIIRREAQNGHFNNICRNNPANVSHNPVGGATDQESDN